MYARRRRLAAAVSALFLLLASVGPAAAAYPFADDAESGLGQWAADPPWAVGDAAPHGGAHTFTDSPGTNYANGASVALTLAGPLDLRAAVRPRLGFWHRYTLENGYDFGRVELSLDGGTTWQPTPLATFTGSAAWTRAQVDLSSYVGQANVKIRFRLVADGSITQDGWTLDDIAIGDGPAPVALDPPSAATATSLTLHWSTSAAADFGAYRVIRGAAGGVDPATATTVATITDKAATTYVDRTLGPKATYGYRVVVARANGLETASNEASGTTLPGTDLPFVDAGEAGPTRWVADHPWAISGESVHGGAGAWSDSPGGNYADNLSGSALTLSSPMNLSALARPVLSFWHTYAFPGNDHGLVEVSTDAGQNWTALLDVTNATSAGWRYAQVSLASYRVANVLVRFRVTTDGGTTADGWHLDDISVSEQPETVPAPALSQLAPRSVRLDWAASGAPDFAFYAVHRAQPSGSNPNATLVATLPARGTTTFTDTGLAIGTTYAWRVYAVNASGAYGVESPTESSVTTPAFAPPFSDGFESGLANWNATGTWSITALTTHAGSGAAQDGAGDYGPAIDTALATQLDLSAAQAPVLTFWDRFAFEPNSDAGHVEVSTDNAGWTGVYAATGDALAWRQRRVDLSPWRGTARVWVRFRVRTDGAGFRDGWTIDDVGVTDAAPPARTLPFRDGFESGAGAWLAGNWETTADAHAGGAALQDFPRSSRPFSGWFAAPIDGAFDLSAAASPQLVFWIKGATGYQQSVRAQASTDGGRNWTDVWATGGSWPAWTRVQASLENFRVAGVRLRLATTSGCCWDAAGGVIVDDVAVEDSPSAPVMGVPVPHLKSADLSWTAPSRPDFRRYDVYRAAAPGVGLGSTRVCSITDPATRACTDTGLSIGRTYYYRVYLVTTSDLATPSNEVSTTTTPLALPVVDPMESDANWVVEGPTGAWALDGTAPHGGASSYSDSPGGAYVNGLDTSLTTAVNLSAATWPVLTFWDRFGYQVNADVGHVDVSVDSGASWTGVYAATGASPAWTERRIDLSPFAGRSSVILRFRAYADGATVDEGWSIDDVTIAEHAAPARSLPFASGFETGAGDWLAGNWEAGTGNGHAGTRALKDFPRSAIPWTGWFSTALSGTFDLSAAASPQFVFWLKGSVGYQQSIRAQVSTDGGRSWADLWAAGGAWATWTRVQVALTSYRQPGVRFRFVTTSACCWDGAGIELDDVAVVASPSAPTLAVPAPQLKSVDLSWSAPTIPNFKQYEVYRATAPDQGLAGTRACVVTDPAITSCTDTGLGIGKSYWYRVYLVTDEDAYTPSNEVQTTTKAKALPFGDAMESDANWVADGTNGAWTVSPTTPHGGTGAFSDSAGGAYQNNMDATLTTAVDLASAAWPVLTFWDRYDFQVNADVGRVEVSTDSGASWTGIYAANGAVAGWTRRRVDLSPWRGSSSVMLRFRSLSDGGTTADGWSVDDVAVTDEAPAPRALPFHDGFESGGGNWYASNWEPLSGAAAHGGAGSLKDFPRGAVPYTGWFAAHLAGRFDLSAAASPQLTFWLKGWVGYQQSIRAQVSTDGGRTWADAWAAGGAWADWTRVQVSLASWRAADVRLRFVTTSGCCWDGTGIALDDVAVDDALPKPALAAPDSITQDTLRLRWDRCDDPRFKHYAVHRNRTGGVTEASERVALITDRGTTSFTDSGLDTRGRTFYRVFVSTTADVTTGSDEVYGVTLGAPLPFADAFEADTGAWTFTGAWGREAGAGQGGGAALTDGPGVTPPSSDTAAQFGVDLTGTAWPVLSFVERHTFQADADFGRVEVSSDFGASWTGVAVLSGAQPGWVARRIDLSPWRGASAVWVRFRVITDGAVNEDGWFVDDLRLGENTLPATRPLPFVESFEGPGGGTGDPAGDAALAAWLNGQWTAVSGAGAHRGSGRVDNSPGYSNPWSGWMALTLGSALDLTGVTSPAWTFHYRGTTGYQQSLRAQVSTDGGVTWIDLWATGVNAAAWTRVSLPLDAYRQAGVRFRFVYTGGCCNDQPGVELDSVGIGAPAPGAPSLASPAEGAYVPLLRPTLVLANAGDPQADALTYAFEVYDDAALTHLVAQVPSVAEGEATTSWLVDVDLLDDHVYWWRARASDGVATGPYMAPATFVVSLQNDAPAVPAFVAPPNGALLFGPEATLTWRESADPNPGDTVTYDLTIDDDPAFTTPVVDEHGIAPAPDPAAAGGGMPELLGAPAQPTLTVTLGGLDGFAGMTPGTLYYWRLRAVDGRGATSGWTTEVRYFHYGQDLDLPTLAWATPAPDAVLADTPILLSGTAQDVGAGIDYVQVSTDGGATWQLASGAGSWSYSFAPGQNGDVTALARVADRAGNVSTPAPRRFTVALPDIPREPVAVPDDSVISVSWRPPALPGAASYRVWRATASGGPFTPVGTVDAPHTSWRDVGVEDDTTLYYVVTAVYGGGAATESGRSPQVAAHTMTTGRPPFVDDLQVVPSGADLVLSWSGVTCSGSGGGGGGEGGAASCPGYWVYEGGTPSFTPDGGSAHYVPGLTTYTVPGGAPPAGGRRFFHVSAVNGAGVEGFYTRWFLEEDDAAFAPGAGWTRAAHAGATGGHALVATAAGAATRVTFRGTGASLSLRRGPDQGIARIDLDGTPVATLDLYAPDDAWLTWPYNVRGLADATHTLDVVATGDRNAASSAATVTLDRLLHGRAAGAAERALLRSREPKPTPARAENPKRKKNP